MPADARPERMILTHVLVPPTPIRPTVRMEGKEREKERERKREREKGRKRDREREREILRN